MNIFEKIKKFITRSSGEQETGSELFYPGFDYFSGMASNDDFSSMVLADTSWVYSLSNINATSVAATPLRLYVAKAPTKKLLFEGSVVSKSIRKQLSKRHTTYKYISDPGKEVIELYEHPFLDLMQHVNPEMNATELWYLSSKFSDLTGNNYWYVLNNQLGLPQELWVLPAQSIKLRPTNEDNFVKEYIFSNTNRDIHIPTDEIIHFKMPSPLSVYYGRGPLAGAVAAANINIMMLQYEEALFKNSAVPSTYVDASGMTPQQAKEFAKLIKKQFGGPKKAGGMYVGSGKIEKLGFSPKDMNVLLESKPVKEQLSSAFGIPMSMLGTDDVNLANAEQGRIQYARQGLTPRLKMAEEKLNEQLCPRWDVNIFCAFDEVIPDDKNYLLKENDTYIRNGLWTINEIREEQGKDPVEWGDEPPSVGSSNIMEESIDDVAKALEYAVDLELKKLSKRIERVENE